MRVVPPVHHDQGSRVVVFDANLCDVVIAVGLTTFIITFGIFFALHSPGELETEEGFRQLPTISLTGAAGGTIQCGVVCCDGWNVCAVL